ncbi:MAG: hypothetical protein JW818_18550, partial [Pirellulales bacterium]|nr:hypothetical protein [Pirellulales bacterium]
MGNEKRSSWNLVGWTVLVLTCWGTEAAAQGRLTVEAVSGRPFGVGKITLSLPPEALPEPLGVEGILLSETNARVLYPTITLPADTTLVKNILSNSRIMRAGPVRREVGGLIRGLLDQPGPTTIYFLFEGDQPLQLSIIARQTYAQTVVPRVDPHAHQRHLSAWWKQYAAKPGGLFSAKPDYPPVVNDTLRAMLSRRLGLMLPQAPGKADTSWEAKLRQQIGVFLGTEEVRVDIARDRMLGRLPLNEPADVPLPVPTEFPPLVLPEPAKDLQIEPIAMRVPVECLYVRFSSYANFLWLQDTLKTWGGDLGNLVALRGVDHEMAQRMERQLILKQTALSRML